MSDKIARLGIERDNNLMYYIKGGDVWASPRKQRGQPKGKAQKVAAVGLDLDYSRYLYFLDSDGDVARKERHLGGKRKAKPSKSAAKPSKPRPAMATTTSPPIRTGKGKKSEEQLDREIEECLAQAKKKHGANGNGNGGSSAAVSPKRGGMKKKRRR